MKKNNNGLSPVIKWPGGKRRLLPDIIRLLPDNYNKYFEPFLGGAAVFFALSPQKAILGDINRELINFYIQLIHDPNEIIRRLKLLENSADTYYQVRGSHSQDVVDMAVRFIYLRRTCFNGLYRVNKNGDFNVPFGNNGRKITDAAINLIEATKLLKKAEIYCQDFVKTCSVAEAGDFVFMDPPYTVAHENNNFIEYNEKIFTWQDQLKLHDLIVSLTSKKVKVLLTNATHYSIEKLYRGFKFYTVNRVSVLAAKKSARRLVKEFFPFKMKEEEETSKRMSDGTSNPSLITQPESNFGPCNFNS